MEIKPLDAMNEGMYPSLMMMIEVLVLITVLLTIAGLAIYLAGIAWFCFKEKRRSATAPRTPRHASPPNAKAPRTVVLYGAASIDESGAYDCAQVRVSPSGAYSSVALKPH
jgi:hypothetical protein